MADSKNDGKSNAVSIALITGILSIFGVAVTAYFNYWNNRTQIELPIQVTQTAEARMLLSTVISASPTPVLTYEGLLTKGKSCVNTQDYACALESFNAAIEKNPNEMGAYWWRGFLYRQDHKYDEAIKDFQKAIDLSTGIKDGSLEQAYFYLGLMYRDVKKDYSTSIENFTKSIQANSASPDSYCQRARAYELQQRKDEAIKDYRDCLNIANKADHSYYKKSANEGLARLGVQP